MTCSPIHYVKIRKESFGNIRRISVGTITLGLNLKLTKKFCHSNFKSEQILLFLKNHVSL